MFQSKAAHPLLKLLETTYKIYEGAGLTGPFTSFMWKIIYMAETYLTLTNKVLARLNEVELTSSTFTSARGIQTQAKTAINEAVRYINQREFNYPFNHAKTLFVKVR